MVYRSLRTSCWGGATAAASVVLLAASGAHAQHSDTFETYTASPAGTIITGQQGYYIPVPDSQDGKVYTYLDNELGIPAHPTGGGEKFVGSTGGDPSLLVPFARSQKDVPYDALAFKISYDVCVTKVGEPVTSNNVGSFSTQIMSVDSFGHIDLFTWTDPTTSANWTGNMVWFTEDGQQLNEVIPQFDLLETNRWYRRSTTVGYDSNRILEISVTDLTTGETTTVLPEGRYQLGGAGGTLVPTGFRFFAGCSLGDCTEGNTLAWDNLVIEALPPIGSCCVPDTGECLDGQTSEECDLAGGVFNGVGTSCSTTVCYQLGPNGWIVDAPIVWPGDTCDGDDNCDLVTDSKDERWEVTIPYPETWTFSLCDTLNFDTLLHVSSVEACGDEFIDDDGCPGFSTASLLELDLEPGTYFVTLEALNPGDCNDFVLSISAPCEANVAERPKGADDEPEPCGTDTNGGCNSDPPVFTTIACGQTYWGTAFYDGATRDTDWYEIVLAEATTIRLTGTAQFDGVFGIVDTGGTGNCDDATAVSPAVFTTPCLDDGGIASWGLEAELAAGTWWFFAAPQFNDLVECDGPRDGYSFSLVCNPCAGDANNDGVVDTADLVILLASWGLNGAFGPADFNLDGVVDTADLIILLGAWGVCP